MVGPKAGNFAMETFSREGMYALFSTVSANLEPTGWGSRFPFFMERLYRRVVWPKDVNSLIAEIATIHEGLEGLLLAKLVWDYRDRGRLHPQDSPNIDFSAPNLAQCFGKFFPAIEAAIRGMKSFHDAFSEDDPLRIVITTTANSPRDGFRRPDEYENLEGDPFWLT